MQTLIQTKLYWFCRMNVRIGSFKFIQIGKKAQQLFSLNRRMIVYTESITRMKNESTWTGRPFAYSCDEFLGWPHPQPLWAKSHHLLDTTFRLFVPLQPIRPDPLISWFSSAYCDCPIWSPFNWTASLSGDSLRFFFSRLNLQCKQNKFKLVFFY